MIDATSAGIRDHGGDPTGAPPLCHWRLIVDDRGRGGAENMAVDTALLRAVRSGHGFLRLYRWDPPCLSFGRHEPALRRYDRTRVEAAGIQVVRRPTGGRAVWHHAEVTYAVAAPADVFGSLQQAYITIHHMLAAALRSLGASVAVAPRRSPVRPAAGACFATPVGGEIVFQGRKLVGSAQYREPRGFLQHGSILLDNQQDMVVRVERTRGPAVPATSLREVLGRPVPFREVAAAVAGTARRSWEGPWTETPHTPASIDVDAYRNPGWTWRR